MIHHICCVCLLTAPAVLGATESPIAAAEVPADHSYRVKDFGGVGGQRTEAIRRRRREHRVGRPDRRGRLARRWRQDARRGPGVGRSDSGGADEYYSRLDDPPSTGAAIEALSTGCGLLRAATVRERTDGYAIRHQSSLPHGRGCDGLRAECSAHPAMQGVGAPWGQRRRR